jgi:hypothetical protein
MAVSFAHRLHLQSNIKLSNENADLDINQSSEDQCGLVPVQLLLQSPKTIFSSSTPADLLLLRCSDVVAQRERLDLAPAEHRPSIPKPLQLSPEDVLRHC